MILVACEQEPGNEANLHGAFWTSLLLYVGKELSLSLAGPNSGKEEEALRRVVGGGLVLVCSGKCETSSGSLVAGSVECGERDLSFAMLFGKAHAESGRKL